MMNIEQIRAELDTLRSEYQICKRKLDSKCEALHILSKDLDQCRQERDQFKLMAEQVQARYQALKRQLAGVGPRVTNLESAEYAEMKQQSLPQLLCEMREVNKSLQFEVDDLRQKLRDAQGDIKLLREQIARQRVGTVDEGMNTRHFPAYEREDLVKQLETSKEEFDQIQRDLQQVLDEKEDLETERDAYKNKYDRLNEELNYILKGDERRVVDIDALIMENKYLQQRLKQMEEEKCMALATVSKYKMILEKKKSKGILKLGQQTGRSGGVVISQKQVHQLLENKSCLTPTPQTMADLQSLASALLESLNDKNMALTHQKKTNKILGTRVYELEKKLKTLEVSGLWNIPEKASSLERLKEECEEIKTLVPTKGGSQSSSEGQGNDCSEDLDSQGSSQISSPLPSPLHTPGPVNTAGLHNAGLSLEDLDLLPTKEEPSNHDTESNSSQCEMPLLSQTADERSETRTDKGDLDDTLCSELQLLMDVATKKFTKRENNEGQAGSVGSKTESVSAELYKPKCRQFEIDNDLIVDDIININESVLSEISVDEMEACDERSQTSQREDSARVADSEKVADGERVADGENTVLSLYTGDEQTDSSQSTPHCNSPLLDCSEETSCFDGDANA